MTTPSPSALPSPAPAPRRYRDPDDFDALHALLTAAFAYMEGRIDPPSSLHRMTPDHLRTLSEEREIWVIEAGLRPVACVILTRQGQRLYIGKLAVDNRYRAQGLARRLLDHATRRARAMGLVGLTLETRVELTENHAAFAALGFVKTGETAHPGYDRSTSITMEKPLG